MTYLINVLSAMTLLDYITSFFKGTLCLDVYFILVLS